MEIGATALLAIAGVFIWFGGFAAGWNTVREKEEHSSYPTGHEVVATGEVLIPASHVSDFGFAYAASEARHKIYLEMSEDIMPNIDMHMKHIANQEMYSYTGRLRMIHEEE